MELKNLRQPCFNTTLIGVVKGVLDFYGIKLSDAMAFGASGHAFVINIHDVLCPSGPYCWSYEGLYRLLSNIGVSMVNLGFFMPDSTVSQRNDLEQTLKHHLDTGNPCSVLNMENQIVTGYDESALLLSVPWPQFTQLTPARLTCGTWVEFGSQFHCNFFTFCKTGDFQRDKAIRASIEYALELFRNPGKYTSEPYKMGLDAYTQWIAALEEGHGGEHGNWWNGQVWGECRRMAAAYMDEIGSIYGGETALETGILSSGYYSIAQNLDLIGNRELETVKKLELLRETMELEASQLSGLQTLYSLLQ